MADILEKIAKTEGNENEISLGELEKHFDEITKDKENDDNQIGKLIKAFEKNIDKNAENFLNPKDIIKEILDKDNFSSIKYNPNTVKVYKLCKRLEDKQERKIDGNVSQEMIKDWIVKKQENTEKFASESIYYDDQQQNLVIKTLFGEYIHPFQESEKGTVKVNIDKIIPNVSYVPGILSDFFTIIDSEENMKKIIKEQRVILFDTFIQANSNPDKEGTDVEDISLSEDGVMTVVMGNDDVEIYIKEKKDISKMTSEEVLAYINEKRTDFKDDKNVRNAENAQLDVMIDQKVFSNTDMDFINTWCKDKNHKEQQPKKIAKIQEKMNGMVDDMMSQKITPKLANAGNVDVYDSSDIKMIQLRANICFGENLLLDGNRGALFYSGNNTENQKITNMYIYRNELKTRSESIDIRKLSNKVVFDKLLDLPNLDALLQNLGDNDIQNKVFGQFLKFFLEVRVAGQYFENLIGSERLESVLVCMINAELLKNTSPSEYFADIDIQKIQQANAEKKLNKDSVEYLLLQMREIIEKGKFETMGKYYEYIYTTSTNEIIAINKNNTTNNNIKAIANEITKLEGELEGLDKEERYQPAATVLTLTEADKQQITIDRQNINRVKLPDQLTITPESNRIETPWGKKKIEIIEKKLQIYEINKNSDYLFNVIYMDIKGSFSEKDIQKLFSMERITKYGVSHQDYLSKTAKLTEDLDKKLEEKQPVIDIMSQFEAEGKITITRPTWDEFEKAFGDKDTFGTYPYEAWQRSVYNDNKFKERDKYVPYDVYALKIPGINKVIVRDGGDVLGGAFGFTTSRFPKPNTIEYPKPRGVNSTNTIEYSEMQGLQGYKMIVLNDLNGKTITYKDFNIATKNKNGNLEIYNWKNQYEKESEPIKTITDSEQESANEVQNMAMGNAFDRESQEARQTYTAFNEDFEPMITILNDFQQKGENDDGISAEQRDTLKYSADDFLRNKLYKYEQSIDSWKEQVKRLETMKSSGTLKNTFEEDINLQISILNDMISIFSVTDGTSTIRGILTTMTEVSENDNRYEKVWVWLKDHGIQTLMAIAGAVAAIVLAAPSGGTSVWAYIQGMTLFSAAVGTLGGMVGSRIGQAMNEGIRNCPLWDNEINGRVYEYDNPTDVELWLTNKMSSADFFTGLGTEFLIGTITTFGFMKAGQIIGNAIAKSGIINNVGNLRPSVQVGKLIDFGKKIIFRNVNSVANNSMETFAKAFTREVSEETFEESIENVGKNINPILGGIITMLNCLSGPSAGKIFQDHNVAGGKTDIVGNQIIQEMTYRAENISQLEKYFIDQEYKKIISENGEIQYVKPMETAETIYKPDGSTKVLNEHVIKLKYSNAGTFVNNSAEFFAKYGMEVNHDVENEVTVDDPKKIQAFKVAVGMGNMGVVTINPDGSAKFTTGKNTIHIKVVTENVITTNTSITETQVNPTLSTETVNNVNDVIEEVEDNQNMLENDIDTEQMIEQEKITLVNKVQIKIFNLVRSLSGKTEADVLHDIGTYMFNNVKHFLHECKHVFGTQLVDVYKSYIQMKKYSGKPGDAEYQKVFQAKVKERGINLTKLVGVGALAKLGIDPHLFFWSGHLIADQLQKHIPFFDKLFGLSFETMNALYSRKKGKNTMYNPQTVIENSLLDPDTRRQKIAEELGLDASDAKNTPLLNALQEAHEVGQDGPGKNPEYSPGVYNYTTEQIRQKMEILKPFIDNGSITLEQVRMLFERGYLGKNAVKVDVVGESNNETIENGVFEGSDVEIINAPTTDNIEEIIAAEKEKLEKFMEENEFDETDPEQKEEKEKYEKTLESYQKALELITNVKTKYSKKLLDIEEKLKLDPTNKKLLTEKEKYQKIQSVLENEVNINKKMTVIDTIKAKLNITKMNINKLWIKLKGAVSGDKINIQNKIDGLTEKTKKLQLELDAHEKDIQSIFEETYQGIRDMKGLTDQEMLELGKIYNEYILKPIGFRIIDFSATFGTDVLLDKNGNTLGIDTEIANAAERSNAGLDLVSIAEMKLALYGITENATIDEVDSKVENMLENVKNPAEKEVLSKLRASMKSKVNDGRLLPSEKAVIFAHTIAFVGDYKLAFKDKTASDVLLLVEANQNKLMHQHVQDKSYLTGSSHNILHILKGNMDMAENFMQNMSPMERVLARQIIIDHDIGYTSMFNKYLNESLKKGNFKYFDATKDHPIRSTLYIEENSGWYEHNFGKKEYNIIKNGILSHSSPKTTSLPSKRYSGEVRPDIVYGVTSVVDCAAASADYKTAFLFGQPEIVAQFKLVYEAMAQGDLLTAEKNFVKIVEIINASDIDIELKTALLNAVDGIHLKPDADGSIPFQKKLNELKNMTAEEIIQEKNNMLKKAKKDNDPKNLEKVLKSFNKANGTDYETIVQLEGATDEQIKKYAMFDYINNIVSIPYQKYLAQYGVRVAKTLNDVYEIGEEKGVIRVNFELSGKTFESLVKMGGVEFALSSFIKVCEDFNIDKNGLEMKKLIANIEKAITTGNMEKTLTQMYGDTRVELVGKNNESVNLNFRGESYGDIDQMIEMQTELNESINETTENMKNAFKELEINKELDQRKVLVADMKSYVADIVDVVGDKTYVVGGLTLPEYAIAIQNKLDTYFIIEGDISQDHIKEVLTDIDNIATAGYFPSLFTKIKG